MSSVGHQGHNPLGLGSNPVRRPKVAEYSNLGLRDATPSGLLALLRSTTNFSLLPQPAYRKTDRDKLKLVEQSQPIAVTTTGQMVISGHAESIICCCPAFFLDRDSSRKSEDLSQVAIWSLTWQPNCQRTE